MPLHVTDTRLAACLDTLGFDHGRLNVTIHAQTRETQVEVVFENPSSKFPQLDARQIVNHWKASRFLKPLITDAGVIPADPMHMLAVMMRAQESYDAYLKLQREGGHLQLRGNTPGDAPLFYDVVYHTAHITRASATQPLEDLALAACLGPLGIGLVTLRGSPGQRRYELDALGLPILDSAGQLTRYRTADLIRLAATGERRLALEDVNPHHPLVIAYDSMQSRSHLKRQIETAKASLLITAGDGTAKQALIALNYKGHVGQAVARHFKAPPGSLGI